MLAESSREVLGPKFKCNHVYDKIKVPYFHKGIFWCSEQCWKDEMHAKAEQHLLEAREITPEARGRQRERRMSECKDGDNFDSGKTRSTSVTRRGRSLSTDLAPRGSAAPSPSRKEDSNPIIVPRYGVAPERHGKDIRTEKFSGGSLPVHSTTTLAGARFGRLC